MPTVHVTPESTLLLQELANSLFKAKKVVVVTGAGISTNSGIPDFRSENGLYSLIQAQFDAASKDVDAENGQRALSPESPADTPQERPSKRRRLLFDDSASLPSEPPCRDCVEVKSEPTRYDARERKGSCSSQLLLQKEPPESIMVGSQSSSGLPPLPHAAVGEVGESLELPCNVVMPDIDGCEDTRGEPGGPTDGPPEVADDLLAPPSHPPGANISGVNLSPTTTPVCLPRRPQAVEAMGPTKEGICPSSPLSSPQASTPKSTHPSSESGIPSCLLSSSPLSSPPPILFDPYQDDSSDPTCPLSDPSAPRDSSPSPSGTEENSESSTPIFTSQSSFASSTSSLATLPNLKGRDLFDSSIWADPVKTSVFYTFTTTLRQKARDVTPTASHQFLSVLRDRRKLVRCYTQNIDQLEERVGLATSIDLGPGSRARFSTRGRASGAALGGVGGANGSAGSNASGSGSGCSSDTQKPEDSRDEPCEGSNPREQTHERDSKCGVEQEGAACSQAQVSRDEDSKRDSVCQEKEGEGDEVGQVGPSSCEDGRDESVRREKRRRTSPESRSLLPAATRSTTSSRGDLSAAAAATAPGHAQDIRHGQQDSATKSKPKPTQHPGVARDCRGGHIQGSVDAGCPGGTAPERPDALQVPTSGSAPPTSTVPSTGNPRTNPVPPVLSAPNRGVECVFLHGSLDCLRCFVCGRTTSWDEADRELDTMAGRQPTCPHCAGATAAREERGKRALGVGKLRPDIVLYGEEHPLSHLISPIVQHDLSLGPDMLLILGTSLRVHGLKVLVKEFAKAVHNKGGKVVFINYTKPPESVWADVIDYWVQWDCDTWVLDVKSRKPALWLPPGSVAEDEEPKPAKAKRESTGVSKREKDRDSSRKKAKKERVKKEAAAAAEPAMPRPKVAREPKFKPDAKKPMAVRDDRLNGAYLTWKIMKELGRITGTSQEAPAPPRRKSRKSAPAILESQSEPPKMLPAQDPVPAMPNMINEPAVPPIAARPTLTPIVSRPAVSPTGPGSSIFAAVKLNPRKRKRKVIGGCDIEMPGSRQNRSTPATIPANIRLPTPTPHKERKPYPPTTPASAYTLPPSAPFNAPLTLPPMYQTAPFTAGTAGKPKPLEPRLENLGPRSSMVLPDIGRTSWSINSMAVRLSDPFFLRDPLGLQLWRPPVQKQAPIARRRRDISEEWGPDQQLMNEQLEKEDAALALSGLKGGLVWCGGAAGSGRR